MMKQAFQCLMNLSIFLYSIFLTIGCSDILVPNISEKRVTVVTPIDSFISTNPNVDFFWELLADVDEYNLRIVSPSFDSTVYLITDTFVSTNKVSIRLPFGHFEWNVVGLNSAYSSACCDTRSIYIKNDTSSNLSQQQIVLKIPSNNPFYTSNPNIIFEWVPLTGAQKYIVESGNSDYSLKYFEKELTSPIYTHTYTDDGVYFYRIRAINETTLTFTPWKSGQLTIDRQPPSTPSLISPVNGDTIKISQQSPDLDWSSSSQSVRDTLYVYTDAQRSVLIWKVATLFSDIDLDNSPILPLVLTEDYYWEVLSVDIAGNKSELSPLYRFWVR